MALQPPVIEPVTRRGPHMRPSASTPAFAGAPGSEDGSPSGSGVKAARLLAKSKALEDLYHVPEVGNREQLKRQILGPGYDKKGGTKTMVLSDERLAEVKRSAEEQAERKWRAMFQEWQRTGVMPEGAEDEATATVVGAREALQANVKELKQDLSDAEVREDALRVELKTVQSHLAQSQKLVKARDRALGEQTLQIEKMQEEIAVERAKSVDLARQLRESKLQSQTFHTRALRRQARLTQAREEKREASEKCAGIERLIQFLDSSVAMNDAYLDDPKGQEERFKKAFKESERKRQEEEAEKARAELLAQQNKAATVIQSRARARQAKHAADRERQRRRAAIDIQRVHRGRKARKQLVKDLMPSMDELTFLNEHILSRAREATFRVATTMLQIPESIGGADRKHDARDDWCIAAAPTAEIGQFVRWVEALWRKKAGSIIEELCENCFAEEDSESHWAMKLDDALLVKLCIHYTQQFEILNIQDEQLQSAPLGILLMALCTMQDVDVDRAFLFTDCPPPPNKQASLQERRAAYAPYRQELEKEEETRNSEPYAEAHASTLRCWEACMNGDGEDPEATEAMEKWIKSLCLLGALRKEFHPKLTVTRCVTNLPTQVLNELMEKSAGDLLFWPSMTSTTLNRKLTQTHAEQIEPVEANVVFTIDGVSQGIRLDKFSQYPFEQEVLLPPFTTLRLKSINPPSESPPRPARVSCDFCECLFPETLQNACEWDLRTAMKGLWRRAAQMAKTLQEKDEAAAKQIQASFRGMQTRKAMKALYPSKLEAEIASRELVVEASEAKLPAAEAMLPAAEASDAAEPANANLLAAEEVEVLDVLPASRLREEALNIFVKAATDGSLQDVLKTAASLAEAGKPNPLAETEAIQDLRLQARQVLVQSAETGSLMNALQKQKGVKGAAPEAQGPSDAIGSSAIEDKAEPENAEGNEAATVRSDFIGAVAEELARDYVDLAAERAASSEQDEDTPTSPTLTVDRDLLFVDETAEVEAAAQAKQVEPEKEELADLRKQTREVLLAGIESGTLFDVFESTGSNPASQPQPTEDLADLRKQTREALFAGIESGTLFDVMATAGSDPAAQPQSTEDLADLRKQTREVLLAGIESGTLFDVFESTGSNPASQPQPTEDLADLRKQTREALFAGIESGTLFDVMATAGSNPASQPQPTEDLADLRKQTREALFAGIESGTLFDVMATAGSDPASQPQPTEDLADLRKQTREALFAGIESGTLFNVFETTGSCSPASPSQPTEGNAEADAPRQGARDFRLEACGFLSKAAEDGRLQEALSNSWVAETWEEAESAAPSESSGLRMGMLKSLSDAAGNGRLQEALAKVSVKNEAESAAPSDSENLRADARKILNDAVRDGRLQDTLVALSAGEQSATEALIYSPSGNVRSSLTAGDDDFEVEDGAEDRAKETARATASLAFARAVVETVEAALSSEARTVLKTSDYNFEAAEEEGPIAAQGSLEAFRVDVRRVLLASASDGRLEEAVEFTLFSAPSVAALEVRGDP